MALQLDPQNGDVRKLAARAKELQKEVTLHAPARCACAARRAARGQGYHALHTWRAPPPIETPFAPNSLQVDAKAAGMMTKMFDAGDLV